MDNTEIDQLKARLRDIEASYLDLVLLTIFKPDVIKNKSHLGMIPFNVDQIGDFVYATNRKNERYSYLYDELDPAEIWNNCTIPMGYASLLICRSIAYLKGKDQIAYNFLPDNKILSHIDLKGKFCLFQNPLSKLRTHGCNDIIEVYDGIDEALRSATILRDENNISILVTKVSDHMNWH